MKDLTQYPGKWKTCYKVFIKQNGKLTSCLSDEDEVPLYEYNTKKVNVPNFGKFFAFDKLPTVTQISRILNARENIRVYRCRGLNLMEIPNKRLVWLSSYYRDCWDVTNELYFRKTKDVSEIIPGTKFADAIVIDKNVTESVLIWPKD